MTVNLIFDFDGTLVDSFECAIDAYHQLSDQFRLRKIEKDQIHSLKEMSSVELIRFLGIPIHKIPYFMSQARLYIRQHFHDLKTIPELHSILHQLSIKDCTMGILTSNSLENVHHWLEKHNIESLFQFIYNESGFFRKASILKKVIRTHQLNVSRTYYIGDENRDIRTAKKCRVNSVAVTWGYNSERILRQYQPDYIAKHPRDLLNILNVSVEN